MEAVATTEAIRRAKLQSNRHHQQTQCFTDRMPFPSPNQQCQSTEWKIITFQGLTRPKFIWGLPTLSLTTPFVTKAKPAQQLHQNLHILIILLKSKQTTQTDLTAQPTWQR